MTRLPVSSLWYQSDTACDPAVWIWWSVTFVKTMPKYPVYKLQNFTAIVAFVHCLVHRFCVFYMYFLMQLSCVFFTDIEFHYFAPWQMFKVLWLACLSVHLSVYLSVCLSAHISSKFHHIFYMLLVAVARSSSVSTAICSVLMVLWLTSCFHIMEWMGHNQRWHVLSGSADSDTSWTSDNVFACVRQVAAPGAKSAVADCILLQLVVFTWPLQIKMVSVCEMFKYVTHCETVGVWCLFYVWMRDFGV